MWGTALKDEQVLTTLSNSASEYPICLCNFVGRERYLPFQMSEIKGCGGEIVARVPETSRLLQHKMLQLSLAAFPQLQSLSDEEWFGMLERAASLILDKASDSTQVTSKTQSYQRLISSATGLPEIRVRNALSTLAQDLSRMQEVLAAQVDREGRAENWAYAPAGRQAAIRIPGNFPTINITWLMALAMRRPVLLCASLQDPFTPLVLVETLRDAGLPNGSISLCYGEAAVFWKRSDQVLWPGDLSFPIAGDSGRIKHYHQGRSKAIILEKTRSDELWKRLANMAIRGCGRLCTNLSTVLVENGARETAMDLADALSAYSILPLNHPKAVVPAFSDPSVAKQIASRIEEAKARGAIDATELVTGTPLLQQRDDLYFLRPTVLQLDVGDPLFGVELPFPFVTVTESRRSMLTQLCRESLIVSIVGEDKNLCRDLFLEPTISKVFYGDYFDRDYDPADPHQGYLADFLFQKKAIWPNFVVDSRR